MLNLILAATLLFSGAPLDWWNDTGVMHDPAPVAGASRWEGGNTFNGLPVTDNSNAVIYHGSVKVVVGDPTVTSTTMTVKLTSYGSYLTKPISEVVGGWDRGRMARVMVYRCGNSWGAAGAGGFQVNWPGPPPKSTNVYSNTFELKNGNLISQCSGSVTNIEEVRVILSQYNTSGLFDGTAYPCAPDGNLGEGGDTKWARFLNNNGPEALPDCWTDPASMFNTYGGTIKMMRIYAGLSQINQSTDALSMGRCYQLFPNGQIFPNAKTTLAGVEYTALQLGCTRLSDQELEDYYNSFEYLCRDAPEWSWTDPTRIAPWTAHYAKCLVVPENINTSKFTNALDASFIGQLKSINWSFGIANPADCGQLINMQIMNSQLNVNTCDWKDKIPGVIGWRNAFGYIFAGLIAISAVFFIFRTFGGSKQ